MTNKKIISRTARVIREKTKIDFITSIKIAKIFLTDRCNEYCDENFTLGFIYEDEFSPQYGRQIVFSGVIAIGIKKINVHEKDLCILKKMYK